MLKKIKLLTVVSAVALIFFSSVSVYAAGIVYSAKVEPSYGCNYGNGTLITARVAVSASILRDQVRALLLDQLRIIRSKMPACECVRIFLIPTEDHHDISSAVAGIGEYINGKITIKYGVPTDKQMKHWDDSIGKPEENPLTGEKEINNNKPLFRPTDEFMRATYKIAASENSFLLLYKGIDTKKARQLAAADLKIPIDQVDQSDTILSCYFTPTWGTENVTAP